MLRTRRLTPLGFEPRRDGEQIANRPGQSVELGTNELVPFPDVIERRLKLLMRSHRRKLLGKSLVAPGCPKLVFLSFQAGEAASKAVRLANKSAQ